MFGQGCECNEFVLDGLHADELAHKIELVAGDTHEEGDGVENVAKDLGDGDVWCADVFEAPLEDAIAEGDDGDDDNEVGGNHSCHLETGPGSVGHCMEDVGFGGSVFRLVV